ncbi:dimethylargininase [Streptomyces sp. NPDC047065]|uniref:dimethylargininase n=1 Tax=Streptomyces sp. NPDC047065 TaxID=3154606 RepID=UPI0033C6A348
MSGVVVGFYRGVNPVTHREERRYPSVPESRVPRRRRFLVCEPRHFAVQYAINPWMSTDRPVDVIRALDQWQALVDVYRAHGHTVDEADPVPGLPDMVFAANCAVVVEGRVFGSLFHAPERRPESLPFMAWFKTRGFEVQLPESVCEGEGDLVPAGRWILAGTGFRTTREAHREVQEYFGVPVVSLTLVDPYFYHLDTALFVLDDGADGTGGNIAYYPEAFSPGSREVLERLYPDAVLATREDAMAFGLNSVSDGRHVFIAPEARALADRLAGRGYVPVPVDLSEFHKAGGGIKCCTQEIRETRS